MAIAAASPSFASTARAGASSASSSLRRALRPRLLPRRLAGIAIAGLDDDYERNQSEHQSQVLTAHAGTPFTTPSLTAIRRATAAPELSAPSM